MTLLQDAEMCESPRKSHCSLFRRAGTPSSAPQPVHAPAYRQQNEENAYVDQRTTFAGDRGVGGIGGRTVRLPLGDEGVILDHCVNVVRMIFGALPVIEGISLSHRRFVNGNFRAEAVDVVQ